MRSRIPVGTVLHVSSSSGNLILRPKVDVKIGEDVSDVQGRKSGTVFDIFGPVSNPFVAVKPITEDPQRLIGEALFLGRKNR